jgi:uncharacterized protein DUF2680
MGAAAYPALADSTAKESPQAGTQALQKAVQERKAAAIREALKGLVDDKTLTSEQADKVAEKLSTGEGARAFSGLRPGGPGGLGGPGRMRGGGGLLGVEGPQADEAAAKVLGMSVEDLRTALRDGSTLAELAKKQGKDVDDLVSALVTVAKDRVAEGVKAGKLTQETADRIVKTLEQRVRTVVQNGRPGPGAFGGRMHMKGEPGQPPWAGPGQKSPDTEPPKPGPSPSATGSSSSSSSSSFKTSA